MVKTANNLLLPNHMDNGAFNKDPEKGTELTENPVSGKESKQSKDSKQKRQNNKNTSTSSTDTLANGSSPVAGTSTNPPNQQPCRPEVCQAARTRYSPPDLTGSPWHRKKTIFLLIIIGSLIVWIITFSILRACNIL